MNCPTPAKAGYSIRTVALTARQHTGQRVYRCRCGKWHTTGSNTPGTWEPTK